MKFTLKLICLLFSLLAFSAIAQKPSDLLDLSAWKLQSINNENTEATNISAASLTAGYTSNLFLSKSIRRCCSYDFFK